MATEVSTLSERFVAFWAFKWPLARMLPEMIPQVATFLEDTIATLVLAFEEQLDALRQFVLNLDRFVPVIRNTGKSFDVSLLVRVICTN